jgi:hypothetical protein
MREYHSELNQLPIFPVFKNDKFENNRKKN